MSLEDIKQALENCGGNKTKAAAELGISRSALRRALSKEKREDAIGHVSKIRDLERQVSRLKQELKTSFAKLENAELELDVTAKRHDFLDAISRDPSVEYGCRKHKSSGKATAVLILNDWHSEERVDPEVVNGVNEYNLEIAERRIRAVFERAVVLLDSSRHLSNIKDIVVAVLGDMITGYLHEELEESNYLSPTEACLFVQDHLCAGIDYLVKHANVDSITIPACIGNHGRNCKRPRYSTAWKNSYEWLLYKQMERYYRNNPKVKWKIERSYHNCLDIQGKRVRFHHGDAINYWGGVGGVTIPALKAIAQWDKMERADLDVFGHLHQFMRHQKFVLCNCLIGHNAFAIRIKADYSIPTQTFMVIDKERPGAVEVKEVFCD